MSGGLKGGVHTAFPHDSAEAHVTGAAAYIDDRKPLAGTLEAWLVTSPHAHAHIRAIDVSGAAHLPGVAAVVTAADIAGVNAIGEEPRAGTLLANGTAEYCGHPVAAVAADTLETARRAARAIDIGYDALPAVLTIEAALDRAHHVAPPVEMKTGDPDAALQGASHRISGEVRCGGQDHFYLETQVALATPRDDGGLKIHSATQHPADVQRGVAQVLGWPRNRVEVEVRRLGGGFGGKESQATAIAALAALLATKTGRPVKLCLPRDADMEITGKRHEFLFRYEVGTDDDGVIQALDLLVAMRAGHDTDLSPGVLTRALCHVDNCYYLPNVRLRGHALRTNTVSNTAFRGFGTPQALLAIETIVEHVARHLGLETDSVRQRNYYGQATRNTAPYGQQITDNAIEQVVARIVRTAEFAERKRAARVFNQENRIIRKGLALMPVKFGVSFNRTAFNQAGALVLVHGDGSVELNHGGTEMGQGLFVKTAQIVSEVLQIDLARIRVAATSTGKVPNAPPTAASTGSDLNGMAAADAARKIKTRMAGVAAGHFGVATEQILFADNRVFAGDASMTFAELADLAWRERVSLSATGFYRTPDLHWDAATMTGRPYYYYTYGACVAEVAIDTLTGETRVLGADLVQDCGHSLNPAVDLGQIEGGFVQGMGWLTSEELVWDADGRLATRGSSSYKIPTSRDVPPRFRVEILDDAPNPAPTIFRSKAVGEPPLTLAIAVWLAIRDAIAGLADHRHMVRLDAPATPERVLAAIADLRARSEDPARPVISP